MTTRTALLSIHEEYAARIFDGTKRFEFRRRAPDLATPIRFLVYVPGRRRLVGEMRVDRIISGAPETVWRQTRLHAGISHKAYAAYFEGRPTAFAYRISRFKEYQDQPTLDELRTAMPGGFHPPQYLRWMGKPALEVLTEVAG
jgi:predicted transcriptional regulator